MLKTTVKGRCWKFGDAVPSDLITPITIHFLPYSEMVKYVLERIRPEFPKEVKEGDILVAGKNFGCSSGRTAAAKALKKTGLAAVVAESFSRTFFRNASECGLPTLECPGISSEIEDGDELDINITTAEITVVKSGKKLQAKKLSSFILEMLNHGGLIPYVNSDSFTKNKHF